MNTELENIKKEYQEITDELSKPEASFSAEKFGKLSKKQNKLKEIIEKDKELSKIKKEIRGNQEIIAQEKDSELVDLAKEELKELEMKKDKLEQELNILLNPADLNDKKDVIMEIRAGAGGDEAGIFAADLFRMYSRYAEKQGWKTNILSSSKNDIGGFKEVIFEIIGQNVYSKMKFESGVHRVQRIPETEKSGRIHTSTSTVAVLPKAEETELKIKNEDLRIDIFRSSGPGGQSVNTTDSAVRITHLPTGITVSCQDEKSQLKNKAKAMQILRSRLLAAEEKKKQEKERNKRQTQIGTGDRSEKIRTYNFPQDRITDHRVKKNWHNIQNILDGELDEIIEFLIAESRKINS